MNMACPGGSTVTSRVHYVGLVAVTPLRAGPSYGLPDKPPSNETGSRFNRRNRAKWVSIHPALTAGHDAVAVLGTRALVAAMRG
jgi:hypothetical protein